MASRHFDDVTLVAIYKIFSGVRIYQSDKYFQNILHGRKTILSKLIYSIFYVKF